MISEIIPQTTLILGKEAVTRHSKICTLALKTLATEFIPSVNRAAWVVNQLHLLRSTSPAGIPTAAEMLITHEDSRPTAVFLSHTFGPTAMSNQLYFEIDNEKQEIKCTKVGELIRNKLGLFHKDGSIELALSWVDPKKRGQGLYSKQFLQAFEKASNLQTWQAKAILVFALIRSTTAGNPMHPKDSLTKYLLENGPASTNKVAHIFGKAAVTPEVHPEAKAAEHMCKKVGMIHLGYHKNLSLLYGLMVYTKP